MWKVFKIAGKAEKILDWFPQQVAAIDPDFATQLTEYQADSISQPSLKRTEDYTEDYTEAETLEDMWFLVEEAIAAEDCFPEVWSAVKAMGQKYADAVYDKYPELVRNADPEWVLSCAF